MLRETYTRAQREEIVDFHNAAEAFVALLAQTQTDGSAFSSRAGETRELLHQTITTTHPLERCIVIPGRKNDIFASIAETLWVVAGRSDLTFLSHYLPRAPEFSDDGIVWRAGYGPRMRSWKGNVDQLRAIVRELASAPESRRAVISLFDPESDFKPSKDVPCTDWLQFLLRDGALSLAITVRSNDLFWGFSGINTFEWSVLLEMVAHWVKADVGSITYFIGSLHVYNRHDERAATILSSKPGPDPYPLPAQSRFETPFDDLDDSLSAWFDAEEEIRTGRGGIDLAAGITDPLLRDYLLMMACHWQAQTGNPKQAVQTLSSIEDAALVAAALDAFEWKYGYKHEAAGRETPSRGLPEDMRAYLVSLHRKKTADYGNSWKKRGELFGILPNIARKVDRLIILNNKPASTTETLLDTCADLFVYALKYRTFLRDEAGVPIETADTWSDGVEGFEQAFEEFLDENVAQSDRNIDVPTVAALFKTVERNIQKSPALDARIAGDDELILGSWALLLKVAKRDQGSTYREFARQQRSDRTVSQDA